jgi:REP element-mobilizing transposase RayT
MAQSLVLNNVHLVFSTKYRAPLIDEAVEARLHSYLAGVCKGLDCSPLSVGGYLDHVHILCNLSKRVALTKLMETVKSHSSKWIKSVGTDYNNFYWQDGYGAFSVKPSDTEVVMRYIENQRAHHQKISFQDEFRELMKENCISFDERYVWD